MSVEIVLKIPPGKVSEKAIFRTVKILPVAENHRGNDGGKKSPSSRNASTSMVTGGPHPVVAKGRGDDVVSPSMLTAFHADDSDELSAGLVALRKTSMEMAYRLFAPNAELRQIETQLRFTHRCRGVNIGKNFLLEMRQERSELFRARDAINHQWGPLREARRQLEMHIRDLERQLKVLVQRRRKKNAKIKA